RKLELVRVPLIECLLREQGMGFAMTQVSRRRADKFCDFVGVLKLGAIYFDARARVAEQRFRQRLNHAGLAGPGWPQKKQIPYGPSWRIQSRQEHLINLYDLFHRRVLPNNLAA